jgi:hypothetical protein
MAWNVPEFLCRPRHLCDTTDKLGLIETADGGEVHLNSVHDGDSARLSVCSSQSPDARCRGMSRPQPVRTRLRQWQRKRSCELANFHCDGRGDSPRDKHATDRLMSSPGRGSFLRPYHHKGARRVTHHGFGHATEKRPLPSAATMTADDEEVRRPLLSSLHNLVGRPADLKEFQDG